MGLKYAVITAVNRDDLPDGGAFIFAQCIRQIRKRLPECKVEVLIPDFCGNWDALAVVMAERPDTLNHNIETVPRVFKRVRPKGDYAQSLELLSRAKAINPDAVTKSGMMVGLGETWDEIAGTMRDLRSVDCDLLTIGQYLRPSAKHAPLGEVVHAGGLRGAGRAGAGPEGSGTWRRGRWSGAPTTRTSSTRRRLPQPYRPKGSRRFPGWDWVSRPVLGRPGQASRRTR